MQTQPSHPNTRRKRRWFWARVATLVLLAVLALFVGIAGTLFWLWSDRQPTINVNYAQNIDLEVRKSPEAVWAWPEVRRAFLKLKWPKSNDEFWAHSAGKERGSRWHSARPGHPRWNEVEKFVLESEPIIRKIEAASSKPELGVLWSVAIDEDISEVMGPITPAPSDELLPSPPGNPPLLNRREQHLGVIRTTARLLQSRAIVAEHAGDIDRAIDCVEAQFQIAGLLAQRPTPLQWLVSLWVEKTACEVQMHLFLAAGESLTDAQLDRFIRILKKFALPRSVEDYRFADDILYQDTMQRIFTDGPNGSGRLTRTGVDWLLSREADTDEPPSSVTFWKRTSAYFKAATDVANRQFQDWQHGNVVASTRKLLAKNPWEISRGDSEVGEYKGWREPSPAHQFRCAPTTSLQWNEISAWWSMHSTRAVREVAATLTSLERYRRRNGRWPSAAELAAALANGRFPTDPFSGKPLGYRVNAQGPLFYSIGNNRDDDGGTAPTHGKPSEWKWLNPDNSKPDGIADGDWIIYPPE